MVKPIMYLALYRKWRPKTFDDVISQEHITMTLINQVREHKVAHAYLFTGSRGTGKTTCAKILAKAVNCLHPKNGEPCLTCDVCRGVDDGSIMDVMEIDAASNNGVDNIRELREEAFYTPAVCQYRVYIIDEAHMLSAGAFNALLKIMEEPPAHVLFVLATTEVHKVPVTIVSRCQRFDFRRIRMQDISDRLLSIAEQEKFTLDKEAAIFIARLADGGMRDALSIMDQCVAYSDQVNSKIVAMAVGVTDREHLFQIIEAVKKEQTGTVMQILDVLYNLSKDINRLCEELIHAFRNIMLIKSTKDYENFIAASPEEMEQLFLLAKDMDLPAVIHCLTVLQDTLVRLGYTTNKRLEMEMGLLKLCSPKLDFTLESINRRLSTIEKSVNIGAVKSNVTAETSVGEVKEKTSKMTVDHADTELPKKTVTQETTVEGKAKIMPVDVWPDIIEDLNAIDKPLAGILADSTAYVSADSIYIESSNPFFSQLIRQEGNVARLKQVIMQQMGKNYRIRLKGGQTANNKEQGNALDLLAKHAAENGIDVQFK